MEKQISQVEFAALFTVLGAFIGAILNPLSDVFFSRFFGPSNEKYSFTQGLILLSGANALWLLGFYIRYLEQSEFIFYIQGVFYFSSLFLFLGSFAQIKKSEIPINLKTIANYTILLIGGDFLWLLGESIEILEPFGIITNDEYIIWKIILLSFSALVFFSGILYFSAVKIKNLLTLHSDTDASDDLASSTITLKNDDKHE